MKRFIILALALACLCGCAEGVPADSGQGLAPSPPESGQDTDSPAPPSPDIVIDGPATPQGFLFAAYGQHIHVGEPAAGILAALPEPADIFEAPSCAFDGVDITYFYPGFELTTYPENGAEHILSVQLIDDSVTTPAGVYLGGTLADMERAYGAGHEQSGSHYTYAYGRGRLVFTIEGGYIIGIFYTLAVGG